MYRDLRFILFYYASLNNVGFSSRKLPLHFGHCLKSVSKDHLCGVFVQDVGVKIHAWSYNECDR